MGKQIKGLRSTNRDKESKCVITLIGDVDPLVDGETCDAHHNGEDGQEDPILTDTADCVAP